MDVTKRIPQVHCQVTRKNQAETMDDRHMVAQLNLPRKDYIDMVAVFDGDRGKIADELIKIFPEILADKLDKLNDLHLPAAVTDAIHRAILATDYKMYQGGGFSGTSTGVIALWPHQDSYLYIANIGDSRAIVWDTEELILETKDHIPQEEVERIHSSGGFVYDGLLAGVLEVSRGFGGFANDFKLLQRMYLGTYAPLSIKADIYHINLDKHLDKVRMVLASDGLWDVMSTREVIQFLNNSNCEDLVSEAIRRGSKDNITVLIVDIPTAR